MAQLSREQKLRRLKWAGAALVLLIIAVGAIWRFTPVHEWLDAESIAHWLERMRGSPWAYVVIPLIYVAANLVLFPNTVLNAATILTFGTLPGLPLALGSSLLSAVVLYAIGRFFGADRVSKLDIEAIDKVSMMLRRGGIVAMTMVRLLPVAPYGVVNVLAGAGRVKVVAYVVGTALGLLPGGLMLTAFGHQLRRIIEHPTPLTIAILVGLLLIAILGAWWLKQRAMAYWDDASDDGDSDSERDERSRLSGPERREIASAASR